MADYDNPNTTHESCHLHDLRKSDMHDPISEDAIKAIEEAKSLICETQRLSEELRQLAGHSALPKNLSGQPLPPHLRVRTSDGTQDIHLQVRPENQQQVQEALRCLSSVGAKIDTQTNEQLTITAPTLGGPGRCGLDAALQPSASPTPYSSNPAVNDILGDLATRNFPHTPALEPPVPAQRPLPLPGEKSGHSR